MNPIRATLDLLEDIENQPETGDILDFEWGDDVLVETRVLENRAGDLLLEMDFDALEYMGREFTFEDAQWLGVAEGFHSDLEMELHNLTKSPDMHDAIYHALERNNEVGRHLQDMMDDIARENRLHPDDDIEQIIDIIADRLEADYGDPDKDENLSEAEYRGRKVSLGKPFLTPDGPKKRSVYVKNPKGNVVKVNFGQKGVRIKKSNPARRKSFRARHGCDNPGPRHRAKFWSCKFW